MTPRRIMSYLRWQARLSWMWLRGGNGRHLALAHWRGDRLRRRLCRITRRAGREVVVVALVEHMGDIIAAEPLLRAVRARHPNAMIIHVVGERWQALTAHHPAVDQQIVVGCLGEWYLAAGRTGAIEYDLHVPGRVCNACPSVTRPTPAATPGIDISNYYFHGSLLDVFAKIGGVDLAGVDRRPRPHVAGEMGTPADAKRRASLGDYAVIHAASNQAHRDWTVAGWREVIAALHAEGLAVAEVGLRPALAGTEAIDHTGLPLEETIDLIRGASLFLGIDSGPAHIAAAAGTPAVVLLGHYGKYTRRMPFSGPLAEGTRGSVIQHDGPLSTLEPERVIVEARRILRTMERR